MNRRQLLALGAGLVVGEPARRAYSFLNGFGFESVQQRVERIAAHELAKISLETAKWVRAKVYVNGLLVGTASVVIPDLDFPISVEIGS